MNTEKAQRSGYPSAYISGLLTKPEIRRCIEAAPFIFRDFFGECIITAVYGWASNLPHINLCYVPMDVGIASLDTFIRDSLHQEIVRPGDSDFSLAAPDNRLEIVFCHEGHIHAGGEDSLLRRLASTPPFTCLHRANHDMKPSEIADTKT